ncbi:MAG: acetyltransferase [Candidatus Gorgyraea atricola]|nr:acetyltransferase [Candidatus Gorgyraea atricola]
MKENIILIGGGGHCKACIDVIESEDRFRIAGIVDIKEKLHQKVLGYEIIACDEDLGDLVKTYRNFLIAIAQIKNPGKRVEKFKQLKKIKACLPVIVSPLAYISKHADIAEGTIVLHEAFINSGAKIGKNCIINTNAIVEHDVIIEDNCHISTGSIVNGESCIQERTFIGSNSVIGNNVNIAKNTVVGAGSVVARSIDESGIYAGNPAKRLHENG